MYKEPWTILKIDTENSFKTLISIYNLLIAISDKAEFYKNKEGYSLWWKSRYLEHFPVRVLQRVNNQFLISTNHTACNDGLSYKLSKEHVFHTNRSFTDVCYLAV
jgi:hypothetical protein